MAKKRFYITTPIYYVDDVPHIGHAYTTIAADVLARYHRLLGEKVFFLTGTDEHGLRVSRGAEAQELSPQEFVDKLAPQFISTWDSLNLSYDFFIRTTDPKHEKVVKKILTRLHRKGFIYEGVYEGPYCVGCEKFLTENELENGVCPLHPGLLPTRIKEKNYFFKLSAFNKQLAALFKKEGITLPKERQNEILGKLKEGLKDLSISRAGVPWGIPVPWDEEQTIYVWVDALLNYYSAVQFVKGKKRFWPADLHLIGKDILWFHTIVWYALLLAADLPLPKKVFAHGFFTADGQKMSKSLGNVIAPADLIEQFGVDGTRYLLLSEFPFGADGDISLARFKERYNADLANGLGNLVSRVITLSEKYFKGRVPTGIKDPYKKPHIPLIKTELATWKQYNTAFLQYRIDEALKSIWALIGACDKYVDNQKPWELAKKGKQKELAQVVYNLLECLHQVAWLTFPFMPETARELAKRLRVKTLLAKQPSFEDSEKLLPEEEEIRIGSPLFPRL